MKCSSNNVRGIKQWIVAMIAAAAGALAACGGGGDGGSSGATPAAMQSLSANITMVPVCSGSDCGALGNTYVGSGVSVRQAANTGGSAGTVPVSIAGLVGQNVTLVYTSQSAATQPMPPVSLSGVGLLNVIGTPAPKTAADATDNDINAVLDRQLLNFNIHALDGYATGAGPLETQGASNNTVLRPQSVTSVGIQRTQNHQQPDDTATAHTATLRQQATVTDGRTVNLWVENAEYGSNKISGGIINTLTTEFASGAQSVYTLATPLAGQPWGSYSSSASLIDPNQVLDIVVLNTQPDGQAYGRASYFWARNSFTTNSQPLSNQSLSLYVNSETIYLGGNDGLNTVIPTLGHEFTHMANFHQRGMLHGSQYMYGTWLEEMTAVTMEDVLSSQIDPGFNNMCGSRLPAWLRSAFDYSLTAFDSSLSSPCPGCPISGSLGGLLLRQYGIPYYTNLLQNLSLTDSTLVLNNAIQTGSGAGLGGTTGRWGTAVALLPVPGSPSGFACPARTDNGFSISALNGPNYSSQRPMLTSVLATLQGFGQPPVTHGTKAGTYSETTTVPAYSTMSIIIH